MVVFCRAHMHRCALLDNVMQGTLIFLCYFGPHDNEQHPTSLDIIHPHRLAPNGSQTPSKY